MKDTLKFLLRILICSAGILIGQLIAEKIEKNIEERKKIEEMQFNKKRKTMKQRMDDFSNRHYITIKLVDLNNIRGEK